MHTKRATVLDHLRMIWAIAVKDILDAIKNRTTLAIMLGSAIMLLTGQVLPLTGRLQDEPRALYYDLGNSALLIELAFGQDIGLRPFDSQESLEMTIAENPAAIIGLLIPQDFDSLAEQGASIVLEAFQAHWADQAKIARYADFYEEQISQAVGAQVTLAFRKTDLYPSYNASGIPNLIASSMALVVIVIGASLVPYLFIEEKEARTFEALLVSPASPTDTVLGKALSGLFYCILVGLVAVVISFYMIVHWEAAALAILLGGLLAVSLGLLFGMLFDNAASLSLWAGMAILIFLVPIILDSAIITRLPVIVTQIVPWIPTVHIARLLRLSFAGDYPTSVLLQSVGVLLLASALLLAPVVWLVKRYER